MLRAFFLFGILNWIWYICRGNLKREYYDNRGIKNKDFN